MTSYIKSKKPDRMSHSRGLAILSILIVFSVVLVFFLYLIQANSLVGARYKISEKQERLDELKGINRQMEMNIAKWRSPGNLEGLVEPLGMVEVDKITYLEEDKAMVAKK